MRLFRSAAESLADATCDFHCDAKCLLLGGVADLLLQGRLISPMSFEVPNYVS